MQLTPLIYIRHFALCLRGIVLSLLAFAALASPGVAQGLFSPVILVNDEVVTQFELEQREQFLRLLRAPGDPMKLAREALIEDRLKSQAAKAAGMSLTTEDIEAGIDELASRTNLSTEDFIKALEEGGVAIETLRDFAESNVIWRDLIRARFLSQARPTDIEIDRAMGSAGGGSGIRVLLSEVIIPITPQTLEQVEDLAEQIAQSDSYDAFSQAATQYSAAPSRSNGGRIDWMDLNTLPPGLRPLILELTPGEVTAPIPLSDAVALFQMRGIKESSVREPRYSAIDYAMYYIPGGRSPEALAAAARLADQVDTCDDLYGIAQGLPATQLDRNVQKPSEIPRDVALELAKLDADEISTAVTRSNGQTLVFLMLCGRTAELNEDASREDVANALVQQRLTAFSQSYLDQLRAEAVIIEK